MLTDPLQHITLAAVIVSRGRVVRSDRGATSPAWRNLPREVGELRREGRESFIKEGY